MRSRPKPLTADELAAGCRDPNGAALPPVLSPPQFAAFLGISVKTIYEWHARGRLANCARRRGKHLIIWRDRALNELFSGPEWTP